MQKVLFEAYATVEDVERGFRTLSETEKEAATNALEEAAILIDAVAKNAAAEVKKVVSCRAVRRAIGSGSEAASAQMPFGASQGSMSALGYSQSWTMQGGSVGEVYLTKTEKTMLGAAGRIASVSPFDEREGEDD